VATPTFPTVGFGRHELPPITTDIPFADIDCATVKCGTLGRDLAVSPLYSAYSPVLNPAAAAAADQRAVHMQASLGIVGSGAEQTSFLNGETGGYFIDAALGDVALGGGARGSLRANGLAFTERSVSPVASAETGSGNAIFGPDANYMALVPERMTPTDTGLAREATAGFKQPFNNLAGFYYYPVDVAMGGPTNAIGASRTTRTLNGYVGGVGERRLEGATPLFLGTPFTGQATIETNAETNRLRASFTATNLARETYAIDFGGLTGESGGTSAFIDDKLFAARESNQIAPTLNGKPLTGTTFMVTSDTVPLAAIDGVAPCACEFLKWGWWTGEAHDAIGTQRDRIHLATWVAGVVPALAELPKSGIATYSGHAIGNVLNGAANYIAGGAYTQVWDFAARNGTATINGFDATGSGVAGGITVSGGLGGAPGAASFRGSWNNLAVNTPGAFGTVEGSFFKNPAAAPGTPDQAANVGGNFSIGNSITGYQAAGTFAATQNPPSVK
jgi:hypothetical protein